VKKECEEQKKSSLRCHAKLCGGGDSLKALGIVAGYLAERSFNLSNDSGRVSRHSLFLRLLPGKERPPEQQATQACIGQVGRNSLADLSQ